MPGEAVTLQLGHYSGCVGAHWWGLQATALRSPAEPAELRAAALLRFGRGPGGPETPTPRLVALELKGGVGSLRADGAGTEPPVSWDGAVADCRDRAPAGGCAPRDTGSRRGDAAGDGKGNSGAAGPGAAPAGSQDTPSVRLWSDYLNVHLHPKSVYVIRQYLHDGDCGCLEAFGQGESLLQDPACVEELEDRLHFYVEECDYLQGFQVLCDLHNGFSGVGAKVTELLHDEYSRKGILTWGLTPVLSTMGDPQNSFYRLMNTALGIAHLSRHSSLFCPLSLSGSLGIKPQPPVTFPYIKYDASLNYHSSAILAAALDTLTAPYRLWSFQGSMMHFADSLTFSGRKAVAAWAALPLPALSGSSLPDTLSAHQQDVPWKLLSSWREQKVSCCFAQSVVLRGICKEKATSCLGQPRSPLHSCESPAQVLQQYLHTQFPGAFSTSHVLQQPCDTRPPFPQFFSPLLTSRGFLLDKAQGSSSAGVESIPVLAALQSSPVLHSLLSGLCRDLRARNARRCSSFFTAGVEQDDFQEALEELKTLSQCYETGFGADRSEDEADSD
ncbi:protein misato homolog 1 isoform X2 [Corvus moneduloides]|uniref:protein misato homolog 1 isoform X2 n=1 Tax=Corvus moneduloides TaxID=1196302 RepID=UPI00136228D5|nr:protein misato homolog 1 isoform X2 [Corvus moneduloides]